jgi:hypothetical protein
MTAVIGPLGLHTAHNSNRNKKAHHETRLGVVLFASLLEELVILFPGDFGEAPPRVIGLRLTLPLLPVYGRHKSNEKYK